MSNKPRSLTGMIHLPDVRLHFFLSFDKKDGETKPSDDETRMLGRILEEAATLSPDMQELMIKFADYVGKFAEGGGRTRKNRRTS